MNKTTLLFYNPHSGNKSFPDLLDHVIRRFNEAGRVLVPLRLTTKEILDHYMTLIHWESVEKVIIAGGDGTIHLILNKMLSQGIHKKITIFPVGTANDFAEYFDLPHEIEDMVDIALEDHYEICDVGQINNRYFINIASFGNLVNISQKVNNQVKNNIGLLAYYLKGIEEIPKIKPIHAFFELENRSFEMDIFFCLIMNGKSAGGFRKLAPLSDISDGKLDLLIFKMCPIYEIMPLLLKVLNGDHPNSPYIEYLQVDHVKIDCQEEGISDLDGEPGPDFPLDISILPQYLEINVREK